MDTFLPQILQKSGLWIWLVLFNLWQEKYIKREILNERERERFFYRYIRLMSKGNKMPLGSIFTFEMT